MQIVIFFHHWVETHFVMCFCDWHGKTSKQNKAKHFVCKYLMYNFNHTGFGVNRPYTPEKVSKQFYKVNSSPLNSFTSFGFCSGLCCEWTRLHEAPLTSALQRQAVSGQTTVMGMCVCVCVCGLFRDLRHSPHTCRLCVSSPMTSR